MANLREQGIDKLAEVKMARMEPDGVISVIRVPGKAGGADERGARRGGGSPAHH